ncbi:MAG: peptidylprolyl isomerase [Clostridia bacterium]
MKEEKVIKEEKKSIFSKKEVWISGIVGLLLGAAIMVLLYITGVPGFGNETIATVKGGSIKKDDIYNEMKKVFPVSYALDAVDNEILKNKYELTDDQKKEVEDQADYYISTYETYYGYTEEEFLSENGFESKEDFINYLTLNYKRDLYYLDYLKTKIEQDEIQTYYDENVYGEINTKHILVEITDDVTDEQAEATAKEIIAKLDSGKSFDEVAEEYEDKVIYEDLGYNGFNSGLVTEYVEASKALENGTYSKEPVKTEYGYHVIYKVDQKDKPSLEEATNDIVKILGEDLEAEDSYIKYKALIKLREDNNLKFKDSVYKEEYNEYCDQVNGD